MPAVRPRTLAASHQHPSGAGQLSAKHGPCPPSRFPLTPTPHTAKPTAPVVLHLQRPLFSSIPDIATSPVLCLIGAIIFMESIMQVGVCACVCVCVRVCVRACMRACSHAYPKLLVARASAILCAWARMSAMYKAKERSHMETSIEHNFSFASKKGERRPNHNRNLTPRKSLVCQSPHPNIRTEPDPHLDPHPPIPRTALNQIDWDDITESIPSFATSEPHNHDTISMAQSPPVTPGF
jgi:hypothetical protein